MTTPKVVDREKAWVDIARIDSTIIGHTAKDLVGLPLPARRLLERAVPLGGVPITAVVLDMEGEIKLKRWLPFTARQILHPTGGFVWNATVGPRWLRFRGGDTYWRGQGSLEFRFAGRMPVIRAAGTDIDRSAAGRLAAEGCGLDTPSPATGCGSVLASHRRQHSHRVSRSRRRHLRGHRDRR